MLMNPYSPLKLDSFETNDSVESIYNLQSSQNSGVDLMVATKWYVIVPGFHREYILIEFSDEGEVQLIRYRRDALSP